MTVQTNSSLTISAPIDTAFDIAAAISPTDLIRGHGPLPAIVDTTGDAGPWRTIGQRRLHLMSNKTSAEEELVAFTRNHTFAYRVTNFTGLFSSLVREARGEWHFTTAGAEKTKIDWTYFFTPTGPIAEPLLWFIVKMFWPQYLSAALTRVKDKAENEHP